MDKEITKKLVETHHALYRVTDLLPQREPMRKMLRENANNLLTYIVGECNGNNAENVKFRINALAKIEMARNMLSAIQELGYCHPVNFEVLQREYAQIAGYFEIRHNGQDEILAQKDDDFVRVFEGDAALHEDADKKEAKEETNIVVRQNMARPVVDKKSEEDTDTNTNGVFASHERHRAIIDFIKQRKEAKSTDLATIFSNRFSLKTLQRDLASLIQNKVIEKEGEKRWAVYKMNGFH
jgi:hypothetical protein